MLLSYVLSLRVPCYLRPMRHDIVPFFTFISKQYTFSNPASEV